MKKLKQKSVTVVFAKKVEKIYIGLVPYKSNRDDLRVANKLIGGKPVDSQELMRMSFVEMDPEKLAARVTERLANLRPQTVFGQPILVGNEKIKVYGLQVPFEALTETESYEAQMWPQSNFTGNFRRRSLDPRHAIALQEPDFIFHHASETLRYTSDALTLAAVCQLVQSELGTAWNA